MSYPFINLDKSKKSELIAHLKEHCGVEKKESDSKEELVSVVLEFEENAGHIRPAELMPKSNMSLSDVNGEEQSAAASNDLNTYPKVRIVIHTDHKFDGQQDVLLWLNGRAYQIQREKEVEVPEPVYKLLLDSKTVIGEQQKDGSVENRVVPNYNVSLLGKA